MKVERETELSGFLQTENKILRQQNKEFKELIQLNRQALKIALAPRKGEEELPVLIGLLFQQNSKLLTSCNQLHLQLDQKLCQALISQQIASASNEHEKYVAGELKERLKILQKEIEAKDKKIAQMIKQTSRNQLQKYDSNEVDTVVIEFTDINKVSERFFKESQGLRRQLELQSQEIFKLKEQKEDLLKLNLILTRQVSELKAYSCQSTASQKRDFNSSSSDLTKFLKYQSKIAQGSDCQSQDQGLQSSNQDKSSSSMQDYEQKQQVYTQIKPKLQFQLSLNLKKQQEQSEIKAEKPSKVVLPKLQLKRAKQIQSLIVKKINNDEKKKATNNKDEKTKKLQQDCEDLRKKLGQQILLKLRFEKENFFLKKFITELQQRNQLLIRERKESTLEQDYQKQRNHASKQNTQTLLDICRDVVMNEKLKAVCKGKQQILTKKYMHSKQV